MNIFKKKQPIDIKYFLGSLSSSAKFLYGIDDEIGTEALDRLGKKIKSDKEFADKIYKIINDEEK